MIDRIVLNDPVTRNSVDLECECFGECGKLFTYLDVYTAHLNWVKEHGKEDMRYFLIRTDCTNPRKGDIVAYIDYYGAILASIYAVKVEDLP